MFCVQSVALEVYGVMLCVFVSLGKPREREKEKRKNQEEGNPGCSYPGGVSVDEALGVLHE